MLAFAETKFTVHPTVSGVGGMILASEQMIAKDGNFVTAFISHHPRTYKGKHDGDDVGFFYCVRPERYSADAQYSPHLSTFAALIVAVNARLEREPEVVDGEEETTSTPE